MGTELTGITNTEKKIMEQLEKNIIEQTKPIYDPVNKPEYYAGTKIEVIDYIEDKKLGFCLGNACKYISRAGRKQSGKLTDKEKTVEDLKKAIWYIQRRIFELENDLNV